MPDKERGQRTTPRKREHFGSTYNGRRCDLYSPGCRIVYNTAAGCSVILSRVLYAVRWSDRVSRLRLSVPRVDLYSFGRFALFFRPLFVHSLRVSDRLHNAAASGVTSIPSGVVVRVGSLTQCGGLGSAFPPGVCRCRIALTCTGRGVCHSPRVLCSLLPFCCSLCCCLSVSDSVSRPGCRGIPSGGRIAYRCRPRCLSLWVLSVGSLTDNRPGCRGMSSGLSVVGSLTQCSGLGSAFLPGCCRCRCRIALTCSGRGVC